MEMVFQITWIRKLFKMLNTFLNWAYDRNYHQNLTFKKFNLKEEDIAVTILMPQELEQLISLDLSNNERLEKVRDIFVFQCYTGQRYSDIQKLDFSDIKKGIWYLKTQKTKDDLNIPIFGQALKVYNKYKEKYSKLPTISNQNANDYIKEICKLAGIDTPYKKINYVGSKIIEKKEPKYNFITTHIARKTFISLSIHNKMLPDTIMKITGHKKYEVFKKYEKLMDSFVNSEMERVWGE